MNLPAKLSTLVFCGALCMCRGALAGGFVPPEGKTLFILGQDRQTIADCVQATGVVPGGVMLYTAVQDTGGLEAPADHENTSYYQDGRALLAAYPNSVIQLGLYMVGALEGITAGHYDGHLKDLADWIKKAGRPVYLRIGYEFDNPLNHYDPQSYKEAFRYIVAFLRRRQVDNAAFVWHSYAVEGPGRRDWMDWYPGDEYVDWFAASVFSTDQVREGAKDFLELARRRGKPFMLAETAPSGMYTPRSKMDWFTHIFRFIEENHISAFSYINSNWDAQPQFKDLKWGDSRVEKSPEVKEMWTKEVSREKYLKAGPDLFESLGYKPQQPQ